jgi:ribosomal protein S18 acetylase RimI-like enzyme
MMPPPGLVIRRGDARDAAMLAELAARTFRDAFAAQNSPENLARHLTTHYSPALQAAELADPELTTLIAELGGVPAGFAQLRSGALPPGLPPEGAHFLSRFYLHQAWVGRGVAQPLMAAVMETSRLAGARYLWLTTWVENPRAVAFYQKCGFVTAGQTTFVVGDDPQVDWLMTCPV